jgi:serine/threonine protein kinase
MHVMQPSNFLLSHVSHTSAYWATHPPSSGGALTPSADCAHSSQLGLPCHPGTSQFSPPFSASMPGIPDGPPTGIIATSDAGGIGSRSCSSSSAQPSSSTQSSSGACFAAPSKGQAAHYQKLVVRAVDFGCSATVQKGRPLRRQRGTPLYSAPEVMLQRYGVAVDVWAAGVMVRWGG